jgi:CDP-diacylglycerol--serine O-phosphatidyltransferase
MAKLPKIPKPDMARVAGLSEDVPFTRHIPSAITLAALCAGATAIPLAMYGNWKGAVAAIVVAAILDTMDGWIARLIGAGSEFGAQLDSLADLVSFGIAPSIVVYMWTLTHTGGAGWVMALIYAMCCAIRLARFNVESVDLDAPPAKHFTGMPTPIGACLILLPMQFTFQFGDETFRDPMVTAVVIALVSIMMVSRVPTFSLKRLHIPKHRRVTLVVLAVPVIASAVVYPWATLVTGLIVYFATIPVSVIQFANEARKRRISLRDDDEIDFTP